MRWRMCSWQSLPVFIHHVAIAADWQQALESGAYAISTIGVTFEKERFPHIYGPLNPDAVVDVAPVPKDSVGNWKLSTLPASS